MLNLRVTHNDDPETDCLYDVSDRAMAARFGRRALEQLRLGLDPTFARLAFSYAARTLAARPPQIRQSRAIRRQHAIKAEQERIENVCVLLVQHKLTAAQLWDRAAESVDTTLAILKGGVHE